jgi:hypothetical protein
MSTQETPRIAELQAALDRADLDSVRRIVLTVDGREADLLEQEMGSEAFERARRAASRGRRRGKLGKVLTARATSTASGSTSCACSPGASATSS